MPAGTKTHDAAADMMMMSSRNGSKAGLRAMGVGMLAIAGSALSVQGARVFCRFVSASRTRIAYQDGYAEALVDIAERLCNEANGDAIVVPIEESISAVAFAQAEAVAAVIGTCSGDGEAELQVRARRRAEAQATAVGTASAEILANAGVCGLCDTTLQSFVVAVESLTANAIAEVNLDATVTFNGVPITVGVVQQTIQTEIAQLLSTITGEIRASPTDGCAIDAVIAADTGTNSAECDVAITANDIPMQIDAVADAGLQVQGFGCDGDYSFLEVELKLREVAVAVAQAVTQASVFCEVTGGPGTVACGLSRGTVDAIATAQAEAFVTAIAEAYGPECDCDIYGRLDAQDMATAIAEASASSLADACVSGTGFVQEFDFQIRVEESVTEAIAEVFAAVYVGEVDCAIELGLVAETNALP